MIAFFLVPALARGGAVDRPCRKLAVLLLAGWLAVPAAPGPGGAEGVASDLEVARDFWLIADYSTSLAKIREILTSPALDPAARQDALVLRARCEVGLGGRQAGVDPFCTVLRSSPDWRPREADFFTQAESMAFASALDLCGPLEPPPLSALPEPAPVPPAEVPPAAPAPTAPGDRPWYRHPLVLGAAGGVALGLLLLRGDDAPAPAPATLPGFPPPPE